MNKESNNSNTTLSTLLLFFLGLLSVTVLIKRMCNNYRKRGFGNQRGGGIGENHDEREGGSGRCKILYIRRGDYFFHSLLETGKRVEELTSEFKQLYFFLFWN